MNFILLILLVLNTLQAMTKAALPDRLESIGVYTLKYEDPARKRPVIVELWYPKLEKKVPLIILSHGHGGDRRNLSWLAESLVQNGFIVASVEHHGNSWRSYNPLISLRFWERARDVSFAINQILQEPRLKNKIDPDRIGFVGYSLGGMTGLSLAGAKAHNVKQIVIQQQANHKEIDLALVEKIDFSDAHSNFAEPRIKAMVLFSPALFVFPPQSLKNVKIPVALVASVWDEVLPFQEHAFPIITHLAPVKLKIFHNKVSHYVFLNRTPETDALQSDRSKVQKEVSGFTADFFKEMLK